MCMRPLMSFANRKLIRAAPGWGCSDQVKAVSITPGRIQYRDRVSSDALKLDGLKCF